MGARPLFDNGERAVTVQTGLQAFASKLNKARSMAIASGDPIQIDLNLKTGAYTSSSGGIAGALPESFVRALKDREMQKISSPHITYVFFPDGSAKGQTFAGVFRGQTYEIGLSMVTGRASYNVY